MSIKTESFDLLVTGKNPVNFYQGFGDILTKIFEKLEHIDQILYSNVMQKFQEFRAKKHFRTVRKAFDNPYIYFLYKTR